jgi:hypothetical protein
VDFDDDGKHDMIGFFSTTLHELTTHLNKDWQLLDAAQ